MPAIVPRDDLEIKTSFADEALLPSTKQLDPPRRWLAALGLQLAWCFSPSLARYAGQEEGQIAFLINHTHCGLIRTHHDRICQRCGMVVGSADPPYHAPARRGRSQ